MSRGEGGRGRAGAGHLSAAQGRAGQGARLQRDAQQAGGLTGLWAGSAGTARRFSQESAPALQAQLSCSCCAAVLIPPLSPPPCLLPSPPRRTYRAHGRINAYMSSPCHMELILAEKEQTVKAEAEEGRGRKLSKKELAKKLRSGTASKSS